MNLQTFFDSDSGKAVYAVLIIAIVDFLLGTLAAFRDGTFTLDSVAAALRKHGAGRVLPIALLLIAGYFADQAALSSLGLVAAAAYLAETVGSIAESWAPGHGVQKVPVD